MLLNTILMTILTYQAYHVRRIAEYDLNTTTIILQISRTFLPVVEAE